METGEELELGPPSPNIQLEDTGQWVCWGLEVEPELECPPLLALRAEPMEVEEGTEQDQKDGAMEDRLCCCPEQDWLRP